MRCSILFVEWTFSLTCRKSAAFRERKICRMQFLCLLKKKKKQQQQLRTTYFRQHKSFLIVGDKVCLTTPNI